MFKTMFKNYDGSTDWTGVLLFAVLGLTAVLLFSSIVMVGIETQRHGEEKKAYKAKCIDAGGAPVAPFDYIKGHGEGYLCINPSAIIEVN